MLSCIRKSLKNDPECEGLDEQQDMLDENSVAMYWRNSEKLRKVCNKMARCEYLLISDNAQVVIFFLF